MEESVTASHVTSLEDGARPRRDGVGGFTGESVRSTWAWSKTTRSIFLQLCCREEKAKTRAWSFSSPELIACTIHGSKVAAHACKRARMCPDMRALHLVDGHLDMERKIIPGTLGGAKMLHRKECSVLCLDAGIQLHPGVEWHLVAIPQPPSNKIASNCGPGSIQNQQSTDEPVQHQR